MYSEIGFINTEMNIYIYVYICTYRDIFMLHIHAQNSTPWRCVFFGSRNFETVTKVCLWFRYISRTMLLFPNANINAHAGVPIYVYVCTRTCVCSFIRINLNSRIDVHTGMYAYYNNFPLHTCTSMHTQMYVNMCMDICKCLHGSCTVETVA